MHEIHETFQGPDLAAGFYWFNEPVEFHIGDGLELVTRPRSDFRWV